MDKLPSKYLDKFQKTQNYHKTSDFYSSSHAEDELSGYAGIGGGSYDKDLTIADKNASFIDARDSQAASQLEASAQTKKVSVKTVGQFKADLGMSFDPRFYQPAEESSQHLIAGVAADKPLITTAQGLQAQLDRVKDAKDAKPDYSGPGYITVPRKHEPAPSRPTPDPIKVTDDFYIHPSCIETYPCNHRVSSDGLNFDKTADGVTIAKWCVDAGCAIPPHFQEYSSWGG